MVSGSVVLGTVHPVKIGNKCHFLFLAFPLLSAVLQVAPEFSPKE